MDFSITEEQRAFMNQVIRFAEKEIAPRSEEFDLRAEFDAESFRKLGDFGILGLHFPEELGGSGADILTTVMAGYALGKAGVDGGLLLSYGAHTFLCADTIYAHGTTSQKQKYLPKLASGELIGCMGLTEPGAGSDVASLKTKAEKKGGQYILNGSKTFITNSYVADIALVYAKTDKDKGRDGISCFIIEKDTPGFSAGKPFNKLGMRTSYTGELFFNDCAIPADNLVGKEGSGFSMALQTVEWDRSALLAPLVGFMEFAIKKSVQYAKQRKQFGRPIADFQAIKHKLAEMKIFKEAAENVVFRTAWCKDQGKAVNFMEAAVAKLFVGDWSLSPTNDAIMLHGGYGYCHEYQMERIFRDVRVAPIGGGTSDIQKHVISRML